MNEPSGTNHQSGLQIWDIDSYKSGHFMMYPPETTQIYQYAESRGGRFDKVVFFGLQGILKSQFAGRVTTAQVDEAAGLLRLHGEPFPADAWRLLVTDLGGRLPVRIRAVPEGSVVPAHVPLWTIENTDPRFAWLPGWLETQIMRTWYPIAVATTSYHVKQRIYRALVQSCELPEQELAFRLHDFGSRGVSSRESAMIGGAAHLVNFMGTDTVAALVWLREHYGAEMAGLSIPAAEHSTVMAWGRQGEADFYRHMVETFAPHYPVFACVSDTYDLWNAVERLWGGELRDLVAHCGATIVIRPDSGKPPEVIGRLAQILEARFGATTNAKGYKVLNHVRIIQGDGVNYDSIGLCLQSLLALGYSAENLTFGMGGALLQQVNRDTHKMAQKESVAMVAGETRFVSKSPVDDPGKWSKAGYVGAVRTASGYAATGARPDAAVDAMITYFADGEMQVNQTLDQVRARVHQDAVELYGEV